MTNDVTKDHSDGIWNESQATVLQADSLSLLTPSSCRRHLLLLQHQQRSSMDTEALDVEDEMDYCPPSPRIRLEPATPITLTPRFLYKNLFILYHHNFICLFYFFFNKNLWFINIFI